MFRSMTRLVHRTTKPLSRVSRSRPAFEILEERVTPNNRFVIPVDVPADKVATFHTLREALAPTGLAAGNIIEIKQGATPGAVNNADFPNLANITIRGEAGVGASDLDPIVITNSLNITAARAGLSLRNLNITANDEILVSAAATFSGNVMALFSSDDGIALATTAGVTIINNDITNLATNSLISVDTVAGANNLIAGNTLRGGSDTSGLIDYSAAGATTDVVRDNILIGNTGGSSQIMCLIAAGVDGLTIQKNLFRDADQSGGAIAVSAGAQNIRILQNTIELPAGGSAGIQVNATGGVNTTIVTIAGNILTVANAAISLIGSAAGSVFRIHVAANDILKANVGFSISSGGASLANVDLGGGTEGSPGGNNFRFLRTAANDAAGIAAIAVSNLTSAFGAVQAQNNLFNAAVGGEAAVIDSTENATKADVITTGELTGNAAFVQALFVRFLRRTGDVNNPSDAGGFVNLLNSGTPTINVVNAIARSAEAMGFVVDDLFHSILNRDADAAGRTTWVNQLVGGATLESVKAGFFASIEYTSRFSGDRAFVVSLYSKVLGRIGSDAEYQSWVVQIPALGRAGVANAILNSAEAHGQSAARLYLSILKRTAGAAEISGWANSGLDELAILANIAASPEGQGII